MLVAVGGTRADDDPAPATRLVSALAARPDDRPFLVGVAFDLKPGAKTYWRIAEPEGLSPELRWRSSANVSGIEPQWPAPNRLSGPDGAVLKTLGYDRPFVLPVRVAAGPGTVELRLDIEYGLCSDDLCVPVSQSLALDVPAGPARPAAAAGPILAALAAAPRRLLVTRGADGVFIARTEHGERFDRPQVVLAADKLRFDAVVTARDRGAELIVRPAVPVRAAEILVFDGGHVWQGRW